MKNIFIVIAITTIISTATDSYAFERHEIYGTWHSQNGRSKVSISKEFHGIKIKNLRTGSTVYYHKTGKRTYKHENIKVKWSKNDNLLIVKKKHHSPVYFRRLNSSRYNTNHTLHYNIDGEWLDYRSNEYYRIIQERDGIILSRLSRYGHQYNDYFQKSNGRSNTYTNEYGETLEFYKNDKLNYYRSSGKRLKLKKMNRSCN